MPVRFNVIEEITKHFDRGSSARVKGSSVDVLTSSLTGVERGKVKAVVQFITFEPTKELDRTVCYCFMLYCCRCS